MMMMIQQIFTDKVKCCICGDERGFLHSIHDHGVYEHIVYARVFYHKQCVKDVKKNPDLYPLKLVNEVKEILMRKRQNNDYNKKISRKRKKSRKKGL